MKEILKVVYLTAIIITLSETSNAKEWRGIIPLHSTRADVTRLLGPSPDANNVRAKYSLEKEDVYIVFSSDEPYLRCTSGVPKDAVLLIQITPKTKVRLSDMGIDQSKYRTFDPSSPPDIGFLGLIDDMDGLVIRAFKGYVDEICYIANIQDRKLCASYYEHPEALIRIVVDFSSRKFDEYRNLPFEDEKARLDNFAIQLQSEPDSVGYIIVYAERRARIDEAKELAQRAKTYLVNVRKVNAARVITIDGGHREEVMTQLYIQPRDLPPPPVAPTVKPSDVQIVN